MISITISGESMDEIAKEAMHFAEVVLSRNVIDTASPRHESYRPAGVGAPETKFSPVDDGTEWDNDAIADWLKRLKPEGMIVVKLLASKKIIGSRAEAKALQWQGPQWAGVWTGPRRKASDVMRLRGLKSWPYGHSYIEPRQLWMHPDIAQRVQDKIKEL